MGSEREETDRYGRFPRARIDQQVGAVAAEAWGVLSTAELRDCGLTLKMIATRRRAGHLHRLHRGVYAVGHPNPPWQGVLLAAAKACGPDARSSLFSAAALWEFLDYDPSRYPDVTVPNGGGGGHQGIRVHRTSHLPAKDRARTQQVPVTSPARTLLDMAAVVDQPNLRSLVRRAQGLRRVNLRQLSEVIARLGPCRGSRRLASVIAAGPAPTRSILEDIVLDLLLRGGFAHPDVNRPLIVDGRRLIPDFRWPGSRLIVEADGAAWHEHKVAREDDAERQAALEQAGERVVRVTWAQAVAHPTQTLARVQAAGAPIRDEGTLTGAQAQQLSPRRAARRR